MKRSQLQGTTRLKAKVECSSLLAEDKGFKVNISVQLNVKDVNDNPPLFDQPAYHINITEVGLPLGPSGGNSSEGRPWCDRSCQWGRWC